MKVRRVSLCSQYLRTLLAVSFLTFAGAAAENKKIDFNKDIRQLLSNNCFFCHGPDEEERKADLRLDTFEGATAIHKGMQAIVPGKPEESEIIVRMETHDVDDIMPPEESGKKISREQIEIMKEWIRQGAPYAKHWAYVKPEKSELPKVKQKEWVRNPVDQFILAKLEENNLKPSPRTDKITLARRLALDLTGLPPTVDEVKTFLADKSPKAVENLVDHLMSKESFGEHWARMWLDLARYADSAGYADDRQRTIWAYRDYVIKSFNENKPFDVFTREQLAGDLYENPTEDQLIATAFHRNTQTNSEGGTVDEEFRNAAVVDRVNTTMAVWMGTTMGCAQCHTHKYDPITHSEYFQFFDILNHTEDADRPNESPLLDIWSEDQKKSKKDWQASIAHLNKVMKTPTAQTKASQKTWEANLSTKANWSKTSNSSSKLDQKKKSISSVVELNSDSLTAIKISLPESAQAKINSVQAVLIPKSEHEERKAQYVRISIPGKNRILSLAEVQVMSMGQNIAPNGTATQSSSAYGGVAKRAIDSNTSGDYAKNTVTHTNTERDPWWQLDLKSMQGISEIVIWNRIGSGLAERLNGAKIELLDSNKKLVWDQKIAKAPKVSRKFSVDASTPFDTKTARTSFTQGGLDVSFLTEGQKKREWEIKATEKNRELILVSNREIKLEDKNLKVVLEYSDAKSLSSFSISTSHDKHMLKLARLPQKYSAIALTPKNKRSASQNNDLEQYYLSTVSKELSKPRAELASLSKKLKEMKPYTTVPIFKQLPKEKQRTTHVQLRGNYLVKGDKVGSGITASLFAYNKKKTMDRNDLVDWLMDANNPLTARVTVNRYWEKVFGLGIVSTSDEFGSQGELPSHQELLDWLAVELIEKRWDIKYLIKLLVTSATYQQTSKVSDELVEIDPANQLLTRGPRLRLSAEMIRDQALFVSGLMSKKLYGPPVHPPQPSVGLSAAFGKTIDWKTSEGEDRYRRALYTEWRRSNPYPSMVTFDAPNREVCVVKRDSSNTPLQALVTMNDPVYVEAAQALARRCFNKDRSLKENLIECFETCLSRQPTAREMESVLRLYQDTHNTYQQQPAEAVKMATDPLGPVPEGSDVIDLAAMTVVSNIILNLDEILMKR